jgi:putative membrane protein
LYKLLSRWHGNLHNGFKLAGNSTNLKLKNMKKNLPLFGGAAILISSVVFLGFAKADDPFFNKASQANLAEIQAGKLAESKGNAKIKSLGTQMVEDHTKAENELTELAKKQSLNIAMSPDAEHKQALADLAKLSGKSFDSAYMASQLMDHKVAVALFSQEAASGTDSSAKAYATKYLPKLKMHLQMFEGKPGM